MPEQSPLKTILLVGFDLMLSAKGFIKNATKYVLLGCQILTEEIGDPHV